MHGTGERGQLGCQLPGEDTEPHTFLSHAFRKIKPSGALASPTPKDSNLHLESFSPFSRKIYCTYEQMLKELGWSFATKMGELHGPLGQEPCGEPPGWHKGACPCLPPAATLPRPQDSGGRVLPLARAGLLRSSLVCWLSLDIRISVSGQTFLLCTFLQCSGSFMICLF